MNEQSVILVNETDQQTGVSGKMEAHRKGLLHRAFSVFIFDKAGNMLLQQRARTKYHGGLLWTNTCCSHPLPGEAVAQAAERRLQEEMGFNTSLRHIFSFAYHALVENGLIEHEFDHVFTGEYEGPILPDPEEVAQYEYMSMENIRTWLSTEPQDFTVWFRLAFPRIEAWWQQAYSLKAE